LEELETVLFDLDGTLTDPGEGIVRSMRAAFESIGREPPPRGLLTRCIGPPLRESFRKLGAQDQELDFLIAAYRRRYRDIGMFENRVYPGVRELLSQLRAEDLQLHVVTSKPQEFAEAILEHFDLLPFFNWVFGANLDGRLTDKRDLLAYARPIAGFSASSSVLVGDRGLDVAAARTHGIFAVGALWGYGSVIELRAAGAHALASSPSTLRSSLGMSGLASRRP